MYNQSQASTTAMSEAYNAFMASMPRRGMPITPQIMTTYGRKMSASIRSMIEFCLMERNCGVPRGLPMQELVAACNANRVGIEPFCYNVAPWLDELATNSQAAIQRVHPDQIMAWGTNTQAFYNKIATAHGM